MSNEYILHLDMDGVITDFNSAFEKLSGGISPTEYRKKHGKTGESSLFLKDGGTFFSNLEWIDGGKEIVKFAISHFKLVRILSSAGTGKDWSKFKEIQAAKINWILTHEPRIEKKNIIIVPFSNLKSRHAGPNRILVDDKDSTIKQWNEKGGVGILHHHSDWKSTINDLQSLIPIKLKEIVETM